jgi:hypothetical protein
VNHNTHNNNNNNNNELVSVYAYRKLSLVCVRDAVDWYAWR